MIHTLSFAGFVLALVHGIFSGSDSGSWWASAMYWLAGLSTLALTVYRIAVRRTPVAVRVAAASATTATTSNMPLID